MSILCVCVLSLREGRGGSNYGLEDTWVLSATFGKSGAALHKWVPRNFHTINIPSWVPPSILTGWWLCVEIFPFPFSVQIWILTVLVECSGCHPLWCGRLILPSVKNLITFPQCHLTLNNVPWYLKNMGETTSSTQFSDVRHIERPKIRNIWYWIVD